MAKKRKKSNPKANCCPRVAVVCKKTGGVKLVEPYVLVNENYTKAMHHKATAHVPGVIKCAVMLGKRAITPFRPRSVDLDKATARAHDELIRRGCSSTSTNTDRGVTSISQPKVKFTYAATTPAAVMDRLKKRTDKLVR